MSWKLDAPNLGFTRERKIRDKKLTNVTPESVQQQSSRMTLEDAVSNADKLVTKAETLLQAITDSQQARFIPVDEEYTEVRQAVKRLSGGNGARIPFDLWLEILRRNYQKAQRADPGALADRLSGDPVTNSRLIYEEIGDNPDWRWLAQLLVVFGANRLMGIFNAPEQMAKDSPKLPSGSDVPTAVLQIVLSLVMWEALQGVDDVLNTQDWAFDAANNYSGASVVNNIRANASKFGPTARDLTGEDIQQVGRKEADEDMVVRYGTNWLSTTEDPKYDSWLYTAGILRTHHQAGQLKLTGNTFLSGNKLNPSKELVDGVQCQTIRLNRHLDRAASALKSVYSPATVCCFIKALRSAWGGTLIPDKDILNPLLDILRFCITFNGNKLDALVNSMIPSWESLLKSRMRAVLIANLHKIMASIMKPATDWLSSISDEAVGQCIAFQEFVDILIEVLDDIVKLVVDYMLEFYDEGDKIEQQDVSLNLQLPVVARAKQLLAIIDAVQGAINSGLDCPALTDDTVTIDKYSDIVRAAVDVLPKPIKLPAPVGDTFIDFNDMQWEAGGVTVGGSLMPTSNTDSSDVRAAVISCLGPSSIPEASQLRGI